MKQYAVRPLSEQSGTGTLLKDLLSYRGVTTEKEVEYFLNPSYDKHVHDPFLLLDMDKAVTRILKAVKKNEKIVIYSDYDTDGIPGAVVLHDFFKKIGFDNFSNYIPHRHDEGFGLNSDAVEGFIQEKVDVLITIDCGITDFVPAALAKKAGIDVIITDHHLPPQQDKKGVSEERLPEAFAIINPKRASCAYPEKMLCGAGVIYKLVQALIKKGNEGKVFTLLPDGVVKDGWEKWLLDMVGIATLSDMVPLVGENRAFAYFGLTVLRKSPRVGIMRLLSELAVDQRYLNEEDIGFTIGPRINAASRMGVPMDAFNLLSTTDVGQAHQYAKHLNTINDERKGIVAALVKEAKKIIKDRWGGDTAMPCVIVLGNPNWRPALVGLVANNLAEEYNCPVYLWGRDGDNIIKGSCRSDGVTDLVALMRAVDEKESKEKQKTFIQFGGHAMSGGFSVRNEAIHTLSDKLNEAFKIYTEKSIDEKVVEPIYIDKILSLADVNINTYRVIEKLAPFGTGNPKPLFMFKNVMPKSVREFGKDKNHLELMFDVGYPLVKAIAFFKTRSDWAQVIDGDIIVGKSYTLIAHFEQSTFRGKTELRLRIVDITK